MSIWLTVARASAVVNLLLLVGLGRFWLGRYRQHGASHTLGLLVVAAFLLVENALWVYFYAFHAGFVGWFVNSTPDLQFGMALLCGLELVALVALVRITWI
ncbi:MAG: hypothetical protein ABEI80_07100 [Haloplanus sp.]